MNREEAIEFLKNMRLEVINRCGSNYDDERYLRVKCEVESTWGNGSPGGPEDTKQKFEEAVRVLTE